ncbi:MAG: Rha family transcriptional regulator [Cardiobacteriaceae bacterium]|nr:Rha family transcriptional regulator [Cardiobacteriaceae bacterium]
MTSYKEPLVRLSGNRLITTSLAVSHHFGKKHAHVLRDIQLLECSPEFGASNFRLSSYTTSQGKQLPMYEITRDGFSFLCMGFTGRAAAQWKEKYIAAFNALEQQALQAPTAPFRLEAHMATLAQGMTALLAQNQLVHRYIALLEMNQKSKRRIKREDEAIIRQLHDEGMRQADIARLLRISATSVNRILHGEYKFSDSPAGKGISELLEEMLAREQAQLSAALITLPHDSEVRS